jgi:hypothetical protein
MVAGAGLVLNAIAVIRAVNGGDNIVTRRRDRNTLGRHGLVERHPR